MMFGNRNRRKREQERPYPTRKRRQLARLVSRAARVETLEDRRLLAVYSGGAITIDDDTTATPYPSALMVSNPGVTASIMDVNLNLTNLTHTWPDDIDMLLVGPAGGGQNALLMSDAGGSAGIAGVNLTFDDEAAGMLPDSTQIVSGSFQPSDFGTLLENLPGPAPATTGTALSVFDGANYQGTWNLFVNDDAGLAVGSIGSWSLELQLGGAVTISAGADANDGVPDTFVVETVGANTRVTVNGAEVFNEPSAGITSLTIDGSFDDDAVSILGTASNYTTTVSTAVGDDLLTVGRLAASAAGSGSLSEISGDIVFSDAGIAAVSIDNGSDAGDRNWAITSPGGSLVNVTHDGMTGSVQLNHGEISQAIEIHGGGGDDEFTIDFSGGAPISPLGSNDLNIVGGGQNAGGDSIVLTGGPTFSTVAHVFDNDNDGSIDVGGARINYVGLEPITDNLSVANRVFTFTNAVPDAELTTSPAGLAATHTRIDSNQSELVDFTTPTTSLVIQLSNAGANQFSVTSLAENYGNNPGAITNTINLGDSGDTVHFEATNGIATGGAPEPWTVVGGAGNDTVNLTPLSKNLDNLEDRITFLGNGGTDTLNIEDDNNAADQTWTVTSTTVERSGWNGVTGGVTYDATLDVLNITDTGAGNDTINIQSTSADATTNIVSAAGDDVFNIAASGLGGINNFSGGANDDQFNVSLTAVGAISAPLNLSGNDHDFGGGAGGRDTVAVNDNFGLGAVAVAMTYTGNVGGSELTVAGLTSLLTIDTVETVAYRGAGGNDDTVTVNGTSGDDLISVAPITANRALVFNNSPADTSGPFQGPPEMFSNRLPGVSGGSARPDLDLDGLANANGLTIDDAGGTGDRLYVYGQSETGLNDGNTFDPFGFGSGNLLPLVPVPDSYDLIMASDTATMVDSLLVVNYDSSDFVQSNPLVDPAVVINAGQETTNPAGVADDITLTLSPNYKFQVNGNDPDPLTTGIVPPNGDRLSIAGVFSEINVFSNKNPGGAPTVTVEFPGSGLLPFAFSSIEDLGTFSATTVNLFGDNNDPGVDQNDNFVVVGRDTDGNAADGAVGEFELQINGSLPLRFNDVQFLNVFGDDQNPAPGTPSSGPDDIDTLEITPWADDTPRGWGIDISFDEGNPIGADGDQADLIILHTSAWGGPVSEHIAIIPSGPDNGEIVVTNASFGTPIVAIDYVNNTDIVVLDDDGFLSDNDSLTLYGTDPTTPQVSGRNFITADFAAAGDAANPIVSVSDGLNLLYRVRTVEGIETLTFETLGGNDTLTVRGQNNGANVNNEQVIFNAGSGDDTLVVDNTNGLLDQSSGIHYHGGIGRDELVLTGETAVTSAEYFVGPENGDGQIVHQLGLSAQTVTFTGLEPAFDFVVAATATVHGTNAANAINYSASEFNPAWGKVAVDGFEPYHFTGKTDLVIQAGAGSDEINLNYQNAGQPAPDGLTGTITVNGGDPTDSDQLIVNSASIGVTEGLIVTPTAQGVGTVASTLPGIPTVNYTTIEALTLVGQLADDDVFGVDGTAGDDEWRYFSSQAADEGRVTGTMDDGGFSAPEIQFRGMGQASTLRFNNFGNQGGSDTLVFHATEASDQVAVTPGGLTNTVAGVPFANLETGTPSSASGAGTTSAIVIRTLGGADDVTISPEAGVSVTAEGGQPDSGSDVLNFLASGAGTVTLDLAAQTITEAGFAPVDYSGFELANIDAAAANFFVNATAGNDTTVVTPTGPQAVTVVNNAASPTFQLTAVGDLAVDQLAGDDMLRVMYGSAAEDITVDGPAGAISNVTLETVNFATANTEAVEVWGAQGDDTFTVTGDPNLPIFIDGGDPIGESAGDTLVITGPAIFEAGPENDEGRFLSLGIASISFDHIEAAVVNGGGLPAKAFIAGNGDDNDITIIARDASTHAGADGVQDFTSTVDAGLEILWLDFDQLVIDARSGDDDIVIRVPAPNNADWDVDAWVYGGAPAAGPGDDGDRLVVETPGGAADAILYTPTADDSGTLVIDEDSDGVVGGTDTVIQIGNVPAMPPMPGFPVPDPGGIELLVYDGGSGDDTIRVFGDGTADPDDHFRHVPGSSRDQGWVAVDANHDSLLGIHYENLGIVGLVTVDGLTGNNALTALGSVATDAIAVSFSAANAIDLDLTTSVGLHVDLQSSDVQSYALEMLDGDDDITVNGLIEADLLVIHGGSPSAGSDTLELNAADDPADNLLVIAPDAASPDDQDILGLGALIDVVGVERIHFFAGQADTLTVELGDGDNQARVTRGSDVLGVAADRVTSDSLPEIQFAGLDGVTVVGGLGSDIATFQTWFLAGATSTNYFFDGGATDTLVIQGSDGAGVGDDRFLVTNPVAGSVAVEDLNGINVTVTASNPMLGRLQLTTLGGDDSVLVETDAAGSDVIGVPITFDGGAGSDFLTVRGNPATAVDEVIYSPGPAITDGRLRYEDAADLPLMTIDFTNLEPVLDTVVAALLTVNGTAAGNEITYQESPLPTIGPVYGRVTVDGFELLDFNNKTELQLDGQNGQDTILINNADLPDGLEFVTANGGNGDDTITVLALPDAAATTFVNGTLNGDDGNDVVDASGLLVDTPLFLTGGRGADVLIGGRGNDTIRGEQGDDLMIGGDPAITPEIGDNIYNGGDGYDTIGILGTLASDTITVDQTSPATLLSTVNGLVAAENFVDTEAVKIDGKLRDDTVTLEINDAHFVAAADPAAIVLAYTVVGDASGTGDRLIVIDDGLGDTVIHRLSRVPDFGTISIAPAHPISAAPPITYQGIERVDITPIDSITGQTGDDGLGRLFVFKADPFEANDQLFNATYLGSGGTLNVDPLIDTGSGPSPVGAPGDQDWFRLVAAQTGTLDLQVYFQSQATLANGRSGLPGNGDLDIFAYDADGALITSFGSNENTPDDADERIRIPVVQGQTYYLQIDDGTADAINVYSLTAVNLAPPVPYDLELNDIIQIGSVNNAVVPTATVFRANIAPPNGVLLPTDFDYVGKTVEFTAGPNIGRTAVITAFNNATGQFTVGTGLIAAPAVGDDFVIESTDTGRSQLDDVLRDATPVITFRLDDDILLNDLPGNPAAGNPPDGAVIQIPFNPSQLAAPVDGAGFRVPVFIEGEPQQPGTAPQTPIGYARPLAGVAGVYTFDFAADAIGGPLALTDGSHLISAKVEIIDPRVAGSEYGFGARSVSLEIVIDTQPPGVYFGDPAVADDGLHPDSDSGDPFVPATLSDNATNDTTPTFFGRAEANAIVRAYVDRTNNGFTVDDLLIGQTVATPIDGTDQHPFGEWEITSTINMNDPLLTGPLGLDGLRNIYLIAEDPAGVTSDAGAGIETLVIFVDTQGPQVYDPDGPLGPQQAIQVIEQGVTNTDFNLFTLKPETPQPTPGVDGLRINIQDLPDRQLGFLYEAISNLGTGFLPPLALVGDHSGVISILDAVFVSDPVVAGAPATGDIVLTFTQPGPDGLFRTPDDIGGPLPDDRYTLTLRDSIIDPVGNALDGENNAAEPNGNPLFPSGDSISGGDFIARFTVDSRPEVATWAQGSVYADINGNFVWDPEGQDNDATNRDFAYRFGDLLTDAFFVGDFNAVGGGASSGFDKLGVYGRVAGLYQFFLDTNDDGVGDFVGTTAYQVNAIPVAGDFSAAHDGDEIGLFDGQYWYLDLNGNNSIDLGERFATNMRGIPVVGDFDGDGNDDLATFNNDSGNFQFNLDATDGNVATIDETVTDFFGTFGFSGFGERPVAGDFNLDGVDDIGLYVPNQEGVLPKQAGEFHFLLSDDPAAGTIGGIFDPFSPAPLGNDLIVQFGDDVALPLFGNFDPPVAQNGSPAPAVSLTNEANPLDTNLDGMVTARDALVVINAMARGDLNTGANPLRVVASLGGYRLDASGDGVISALDALRVINGLLELQGGEAEPLLDGDGSAWAGAADQALAGLNDDDDEELWLILSEDQLRLGAL